MQKDCENCVHGQNGRCDVFDGIHCYKEKTWRSWVLFGKELSFWMVLRDGSTYISKKHLNYHDAINEAKRLGEKYPNIRFYILQAKEFVVQVPRTEFNLKKEGLI